MFESSDEREWNTNQCCLLAHKIRTKYAEELHEIDNVFKSLYSDLRNADHGALSPERLDHVKKLAVLINEEDNATYAEPSLTSLRASEEEDIDLTADDAQTQFALIRLLCKLGQYPLAMHRMVDIFSKFHMGYTFKIETVSGPWFPAVTYSVESLNIPNSKDSRAVMSGFQRFLKEELFFHYGEPTLIETLGPKYYKKLMTQRKLYVHGEVKLACILLARGIEPVNSKISGSKLCCYTCNIFLK